MAKTILSQLIFWTLMTLISLGSGVVVVLFYLPYVALRAVYLGVRGKLHTTTGRPREKSIA